MGKRRVNFQRCWLPVSRIGLHRRGVERVNCGPKLLDLGEKGVYSSYTCSSDSTRAVISRETLITSTTAPVYVSRMARLAISNQRRLPSR